MQCGMFSWEARAGGASMVMIDMRYMWSDIDSPDVISSRRQPSRLVVLRRSRRWKKGRGELVVENEGRLGTWERAGCEEFC